MPEPTDMIVPMLREMRDETRQGFKELRGEMRSRFDEVDARLRAVERLVKAQREGRSRAKAFSAATPPIAALERKVEALETRE